MKTAEEPKNPAPIRSKTVSDPEGNSPRARTFSLLAIALLCVPVFFFRLGAYALFDADESRYAEIPRAMLATGDWVTPMLNGVKFFDKPPLLYWLSAFCFQIFGVNDFAARLVPALAATAAVFGAYALGRKMFGPRAGLFSGTILATTLAWPIMGRVVLTDMLVSSLIFLSLAFWWIGRVQTDKSARFWAFFGFWTALGLGVLAKGPVALVLAFGTIALFCLLSGERAVLRQMGWIPGLIWGFVIAAPWFIIVQGRNPEYNHAFWFEQNFKRFMGGLPQLDHANGPLYFVYLIPILFLPWTFFAPHALIVGWKKVFPPRGQMRGEKGRAMLFLGCGVAFTTLFFSSSPGKLVTYILPVVPLLAVALAGYFEWMLKRDAAPRAARLAALCIAFLGLIVGIAGLILGPDALVKAQASGESALTVGAAILVSAVALGYCALKRDLKSQIAATAVGFALIFAAATSVLKAIGPTLTTPSLLRVIQPGLDEGGEIVAIGFTQSLSFYTGRRIPMVDRPDELRSGLSHLPPDELRRFFMEDESELKPYFSKPTPVYLVLRAKTWKKLREQRDKIDALGGDFEAVARNSRFTILGNVAARRITPALSE